MKKGFFKTHSDIMLFICAIVFVVLVGIFFVIGLSVILSNVGKATFSTIGDPQDALFKIEEAKKLLAPISSRSTTTSESEIDEDALENVPPSFNGASTTIGVTTTEPKKP